MWAFQRLFRTSVEFDLQRSLEAVGIKPVVPAVFLVGVPESESSNHPLCIEPDKGPIVRADFGELQARADSFYDQDPQHAVRLTNAGDWIHQRREQEARGRAYGKAISEVLGAKLGLQFSVSQPTPKDGYLIYIAVGLPHSVFNEAPRLRANSTTSPVRMTLSLVDGVIDRILELGHRELYRPYAGADLSEVDAIEVTTAAAESLLASAAFLVGHVPSNLFDDMNRLAITRYEGRVGIGSLLFTSSDGGEIDHTLTLLDPVPLSESRALRKLLEISSLDGDSLLTDGRAAYGLGRLKPGDGSGSPEAVLKLEVTGDGEWRLTQSDVALMRVAFAEAKLPKKQLQPERFHEICSRTFEDYDHNALWSLAEAAQDAEHGTMVVISAQAEVEATRLARQAQPIKPAPTDSFIKKVTAIDGAVLVDPHGRCHAIGVILDGIAGQEGDRSRGARYNSALKYLASKPDTPTVIVLVSEDKIINLLPDLLPQIGIAERDSLLTRLQEASETDPVDGEQFYRAYRQIQEYQGYFSDEQIDEINGLMDDHWRRRMDEAGPNAIRVIEPKLQYNGEIRDDLLTDN
jgi:hypothetical protein